MDPRYIAALVFILFMIVFLHIKRKKISSQEVLPKSIYFQMFRTKLGLKFMDKFAKRFSKPLKYIGYFAIFIGFLGMIVITYALVQNVYNLLTKPEAVPGAALVLPFEVKGAFYVPFDYWILAIFVIAIVHEFSHGILTRKYNMKIKSSGFAFLNIGFRAAGILIIFFALFNKVKGAGLQALFTFTGSSQDLWLLAGIIFLVVSIFKNLSLPLVPAAFVEPDEKEIQKAPKVHQLSVFAAGPFSNILLAFLIVGLTALIATPITNTMIEEDGVLITGLIQEKEYPAQIAGIQKNEVVTKIGDEEIATVKLFSEILDNKIPGDSVIIQTNKSSYSVVLAENPINKSKAYLGVYVKQHTKIKESFVNKYGKIAPKLVIWLMGLLYWLYVLNLGIGLFNLAPMGPLDGGRMLLVALQKFLDEKKAKKYWKNIGLFFLALVLVNILFAFFR